MRSRQYSHDILAPENRKPRPGQGPVPQVEAEPGLVVEDFEGRFCGAVVAVDSGAVTLEDRNGKRRLYRHICGRCKTSNEEPRIRTADRQSNSHRD